MEKIMLKYYMKILENIRIVHTDVNEKYERSRVSWLILILSLLKKKIVMETVTIW